MEGGRERGRGRATDRGPDGGGGIRTQYRSPDSRAENRPHPLRRRRRPAGRQMPREQSAFVRYCPAFNFQMAAEKFLRSALLFVVGGELAAE